MKISFIRVIFLLFPFVFFACAQNSGNESDVQLADTVPRNTMNSFPFETYELDGGFVILTDIEGAELYPKYVDFFEQFGYSGNGYCWEGHIVQILEKMAPELLSHIEFDPEAGAFYAYADTKANQLRFVELLSPIFSDLNHLKKYVGQADHSRIND
jgi:hypothetical protein